METWIDMIGYEGYYQVSSEGRIRSVDRLIANPTRKRKGKIMKQCIDGKGYKALSISKDGKFKMLTVHRLVAMSFLGYSNLTVNHKNGIKTDNRIKNLEFMTQKENNRHANRLGLVNYVKGEKCHLSKLTGKDVLEIRKMEGVKTRKQLSIMYGVCEKNIRNIQSRKTWKHI